MKRLSQFTHRLIYDNKLLLIVSLAVAVFVWLFVTIVLSPDVTITIADVPIEIDMNNSVPESQSLQPFGDLNYTVDVVVTGKRYAIGSLTAESNAVKVIAQTQYANTVGKCRLGLKATKTEDTEDFEIVSLSTDAIEVYFDRLLTKEFKLIPDLSHTSSIAADGYKEGEFFLSPSKVIVQGPEMEVKTINRVKAKCNLDKSLTETTNIPVELVALNENNGEVHYLTYSETNVTLTIPIYKVVTKDTSVSFINAPSAFSENPPPYSIDPVELKAGVPSGSENDQTLNLRTIDFSELKPGENEFEDYISHVKNIISINPLVNEYKVTVYLDPQEYASVTRWVKNSDITLTNQPDDLKDAAIVDGVKSVTVVGPVSSLQYISADDISVTVDMTNATSAKKQTFDAKVKLKNSDDCWIYGTYQVTVELKN